MSPSIYLFVLVSVALSAAAQIVMKYGVDRAMANEGGSALSPVRVIEFLAHPAVFLGLALYAVGALFWLMVLSRMDVTKAYPFVGLGFLLTLVFGALFLKESVGMTRAIGTAFVAVGVVLVARS